MGKISDNRGVYMTIMTSDIIISKKTSQLLLTIPIQIYRTLFARIRPDRIGHLSCVKKRFPNVLLECWMEK